jgi:tetratricopeptide (TPR) repeat protein
MKPATPEATRVVEPGREMAGISDSKYRGALGKPTLWRAVLIVAAGLWVFWPALRGGWVWDDHLYINDNFQLRTLGGLWNIWFSPGSQRDYYPILQTALWVEWQLWHNETLGYHVVTLVLHLLSALLVWRLLDKLGLRLAWLGGLLFAIHPVQVESAAWAAELKNTLSLPPLLLAMGFYLDYEESRKLKDYFLAIVLFLAALLCKLTVVMFPVVILLYAWWKRGRIGWGDIKVSAPFFVVSLAVGLVTIVSGVWDKQFDDLGSGYVPEGGLLSRLVLAGQEIAFYFSKSFLPVGLLPIYPKWAVDAWSPVDYLPWVVLGGVVWWLWTKRQSWGRHALLGLGFFVVNLMPCPGFIPTPNMGFAWTMDHFLYLPIIGLIGLVVAAMGQAEERLAPTLRPIGVGIVAVIFALLAWESRSYAGIFIDEETFWTYTLRHNPEAWPARNNLANVLSQKGDIDEAISESRKALEINPNYVEAHNNLGNALLRKGRVDEAIIEYQKALEINANTADTHSNLANAFILKKRIDEAIAECREALGINPNMAEAHYSLGNALLQKGQTDEAIAECQKALELDPTLAQAHYSIGNALFQKGRADAAAVQFQQALEIDPNDAKTHNNLGLALFQKGRVDEAMDQYDKALEINPNTVDAHYNLGLVLFQKGRVDEAIVEYEKALKIDPDYGDARDDLGNAFFRKGQAGQAIVEYEKALGTNPNNALVHYNLGYALFQTGQVDASIAQFKEALRLKPDFAEAKNDLLKIEAIVRQKANHN